MSLDDSVINMIVNNHHETDLRIVVDKQTVDLWYVGLTLDQSAVDSDAKWLIYQIKNMGVTYEVNNSDGKFLSEWVDRDTIEYVPLNSISCSSFNLYESMSVSAVIGMLTASGGVGDYTFNIITDTDSKFSIVDGDLVLENVVTYPNTHDVTIRVTDEAASTLDATLTFTVIEATTEYSVALNGTDEYYVEETYNDVPSGNASFNVWVYRNALGDHCYIGNYYGAPSNTLIFRVLNEKTNFWFSDDGTNGSWVNGVTTIPINEWVMVTATIGGGFISLYVNGAVDVSAAADARAYMHPGSSAHQFGVYATTYNMLDGLLKSALVYDKVLTDAEVVTIYNAGFDYDPTSPGAPSNNVSWFDFGGTYEEDLGDNIHKSLDTVTGYKVKLVNGDDTNLNASIPNG